MKKLMLFILVLLLANVAIGAEIVVNDSTSVSLYVVIQDSSGDPNTGVTITDLDFFWIEQGAAVESDITITALSAADAVYATGQAIHVQSGMYRVDFPDDCFNGGIGKQVQLIVDDTGTSNRTAFLTVMLSPQVDVNTVVGTEPIPEANITTAVWDATASEHVTGGTFGDRSRDTDANVTLILADTGTAGVVLAADAITAAKIADDAFSNEHFNADFLTAAEIADDAFAAEHFATNAIGADALAADATALIWAEAMVDIGANAPPYNASALVALNYLYELMRNQTWVTATKITVYKDNASTILMESTISDDGTTFKKGEYRAAN